MSGPKVVRIVTREEVIALCHGLLARVDAALAAWEKAGARHGCVSEAELEVARERRRLLDALLASDRLLDLQKEAAREEVFLRDDLQSRLARVSEAQAAARARGRRIAEMGSALSARLKARGMGDAALHQALRGSAEAREAAIAKGLAMIGDAAATGRASERQRLADELGAGLERRSFDDWLEASTSEADPQVEALERRLVEMEMLGSEPAAMAAMRERLTAAEAEATPARRNLLFDALGVELARFVQFARALDRARSLLEAAIVEARAAGIPSREVPKADLNANAEELEALAAKISQMTAAQRASDGAKARREAVLKGLEELGYEVTEGMSAEWVEAGRLTVRSAARRDYGVELAGGAEGGKVQMSPIAFTAHGSGPDPSRDRDAETIWCGDVGSLSASLAAHGGELVIEKALPIGARPLKRVAVVTGTEPPPAAEAPVLKSRTLDR